MRNGSHRLETKKNWHPENQNKGVKNGGSPVFGGIDKN